MNLIEIWKNRGLIAEGIANSIFIKQDVEDIAQSRLEICKRCEFYDQDGDGCAVYGTEPCCSACGCSLAFKSRSLASSCPHNKWGAVLTEEESNLLNENLNNDSI